jgi:hypothetical protein
MKYSAGMVSKPFWFAEFKKVIKLLKEGCSFDDIKKMNLEENLFGVAKEYRGKEIYNCVSSRAKVFTDEMINLFCTSDIATQKVMALISVLKTDKLFYEFLYEVYREKVIIGIMELEDSDISIFFKNKQAQDETVASWKDYTLKKLRNSYINYLRDAGLIFENESKKEITPPILDVALERYLQSQNEQYIVKALTGENCLFASIK